MMVKEMDKAFHSPTFGQLSLSEVIAKIQQFRDADTVATYRFFIGTDSLPTPTKAATLVTAIVYHRQGHGAIYFWTKQRFEKLATLRDRMYQEALNSIEVARTFVDASKGTDVLTGDIEIHVDVGHIGETRAMIKEIVGMVTANGFPVKTKPEAVAASKVADRHTTTT